MPARGNTHRTADVRVGISGYNYPSWRGNFYPETGRAKDWLR